jgi:hypothetical protein
VLSREWGNLICHEPDFATLSVAILLMHMNVAIWLRWELFVASWPYEGPLENDLQIGRQRYPKSPRRLAVPPRLGPPWRAHWRGPNVRVGSRPAYQGLPMARSVYGPQRSKQVPSARPQLARWTTVPRRPMAPRMPVECSGPVRPARRGECGARATTLPGSRSTRAITRCAAVGRADAPPTSPRPGE